MNLHFNYLLTKNYPALLLLLTFAFPPYAHATKGMVRGEPLTATEIMALDPVCKLILVENYYVHNSWNSQRENAELFERPEYRMAKNALSLHHRCWATVSKMRYLNAQSAKDKKKYIAMFHGDMDFVINSTNYTPRNWAYMPLMHVEKGDMYYLDRKYIEAISEAYNALNQNPAFIQAYRLLIKTYNAMGEKKKALENATEGLKHNPQSNTLKRMYDQMGGAQPYPEPYIKPTEQDMTEALSPTTENSVTKPPSEASEPDQSKIPEVNIPPNETNIDNQSKPNPYCRFCP